MCTSDCDCTTDRRPVHGVPRLCPTVAGLGPGSRMTPQLLKRVQKVDGTYKVYYLNSSTAYAIHIIPAHTVTEKHLCVAMQHFTLVMCDGPKIIYKGAFLHIRIC